MNPTLTQAVSQSSINQAIIQAGSYCRRIKMFITMNVVTTDTGGYLIQVTRNGIANLV
jgi:hypothetical protein